MDELFAPEVGQDGRYRRRVPLPPLLDDSGHETLAKLDGGGWSPETNPALADLWDADPVGYFEAGAELLAHIPGSHSAAAPVAPEDDQDDYEPVCAETRVRIPRGALTAIRKAHQITPTPAFDAYAAARPWIDAGLVVYPIPEGKKNPAFPYVELNEFDDDDPRWDGPNITRIGANLRGTDWVVFDFDEGHGFPESERAMLREAAQGCWYYTRPDKSREHIVFRFPGGGQHHMFDLAPKFDRLSGFDGLGQPANHIVVLGGSVGRSAPESYTPVVAPQPVADWIAGVEDGQIAGGRLRRNGGGKLQRSYTDFVSPIPDGARRDTLVNETIDLIRAGADEQMAFEWLTWSAAERCRPPYTPPRNDRPLDRLAAYLHQRYAPKRNGRTRGGCAAVAGNRSIRLRALVVAMREKLEAEKELGDARD